jgi:hypothetical protein
MMTMVVALFQDLCVAQRAVADLVNSGFPRDVISVLVRDLRRAADQAAGDDDGRDRLADRPNPRVLAGGPLGAALEMSAHDESAVADALTRAGLQPAAARFFADAVGEGGILVGVLAKEETVRDARDILDFYATPEPRFKQQVAAHGD